MLTPTRWTRKRQRKRLGWVKMNGRNCARYSIGVTNCVSAEAATAPTRSLETNRRKFCGCWKVCGHENPNTSWMRGGVAGERLDVDCPTSCAIRQSQSAIRGGRFQSSDRELPGAVRSGQDTPNLFYNLGNAHVRQKDFGRAILN